MIRLNPESEGMPQERKLPSFEALAKEAYAYLSAKLEGSARMSVEEPSSCEILVKDTDTIEIVPSDSDFVYSLTKDGQLSAKDYSSNAEGEDVEPHYGAFAIIFNRIKKTLSE